MDKLDREVVQKAVKMLKGHEDNIFDIVWDSAGQLLGFSFDSAVKMALAWGPGRIKPVGFNYPTKIGFAADVQSSVNITVPVSTVKYYYAGSDKIVTLAEASAQELAQMAAGCLVEARKEVSGTAYVACYDFAKCVSIWSNRSVSSALDEIQPIHAGRNSMEALEMVLNRMGYPLSVALSFGKAIITRELEGCDPDMQNVLSEYLKGEIEAVTMAVADREFESGVHRYEALAVLSAIIELSVYFGGNGRMADSCEYFGDGINCTTAYSAYKRAFISEFSLNSRETPEEFVEVAAQGHLIASRVAELVHDGRYNYQSKAKDNFDTIQELVMEAAADSRLRELSSNYIQRKLQNR